ncbi:MAG: FMN reductase [Curvibacter sp. PD_MW3]|nr:MAG: FMN reductase [Curvibacter sp. PD_MW3]
MNVLALCGSLRQQSRSLALLQAIRALAPGSMDVTLFAGLGDLPLFNPDLEPCAPKPVQALWDAVAQADALVIASPEYAHGVTGTIKNALDWLVGLVPFTQKPVAVLNPSHRAQHADDALREILCTMNAQLIPEACLRIPVTACDLNAEALASDPTLSTLIRSALAALDAFHANGLPRPGES